MAQFRLPAPNYVIGGWVNLTELRDTRICEHHTEVEEHRKYLLNEGYRPDEILEFEMGSGL